MYPSELKDPIKPRGKDMSKSKKHWMQKAVPESHKGIFTAKAKAHGESVHEYAEQEKHAGGKLGKEANLALTFEDHAHHSYG
jgi:hypothetical protein